MKAYIVTGAPGTGKTSVIKALSKNTDIIGLEEIPRKLIKEKTAEKLGFEPFEDISRFAALVFKNMLDQYKKNLGLDKIVFFDRALPDVLAYLYSYKLEIPAKYFDIIKNTDYQNKIFYCSPWEEIYRTDSERPYPYEQTLIIDEYLMKSYKSLGFEINILPKDNIEKRVDFVLSQI